MLDSTSKRVPAKNPNLRTPIPIYKMSGVPAPRRVKDLLSRMTLEEKAAQMMCVWQEKAPKLVDAEGNFDFKKAKAAFKKGHGIGQVGRPSDAGSSPAAPANGQTARGMAELTNAIQKFFLEHSRLGIPVIFHEECLHGHAASDGTSFSATHRPGRDVQSRTGREALHDDGRGSAHSRHAPGADAGGGRGA